MHHALVVTRVVEWCVLASIFATNIQFKTNISGLKDMYDVRTTVSVVYCGLAIMLHIVSVVKLFRNYKLVEPMNE